MRCLSGKTPVPPTSRKEELMAEQDFAKVLTMAAFNLSTEDSLRGVFHHQLVGNPVPSGRAIREVVDLSRAILFPSYFGNSNITRHSVRYHIGVNIEKLFDVLSKQITAALCFAQSTDEIDPRKQEADSPCYSCTGTGDCAFDVLKKDAHDREIEAILSREAHRASVQSELKSNAMSAPLAAAAHVSGTSLNQAAGLGGQAAGLGGQAAGKWASMSPNLGEVPYKKDEASGRQDKVVAGKTVEGQLEPDSTLLSLAQLEDKAKQIALQYISVLPTLRVKLAKDAKSAFFADPAATSLGEVICCYPGVRAIINYRIAHELLKLGVPFLPRVITEMAHSETGIDIHPGAQIGDCFSIDHGTGVVIGETCIIGNNVKLFQGVTLGAKTIPVDEKGVPLKIARHPILEDDVVVYSNATILGRITIGRGAVIGGNVWITESVMPGMKVVQQRARQ